MLVKYVSMSLILSNITQITSNGIIANLFYKIMIFFYCAGSLSLIINYIWAMRKFKEAITVSSVSGKKVIFVKKLMIVIEIFKVLAVFLVTSKYGNIFDYTWATALLPIWPLFYIYFGMTILLSCNFLMKVMTVCCSKNDKNECINFIILSFSFQFSPFSMASSS